MFFNSGPQVEKFIDREEAGFLLGERLKDAGIGKEALVIGILRGGVVVAYHAARILRCPLHILSIRKLVSPHNAELAIGAVGSRGRPFFDQDLIDSLSVSEDYLREEVEVKREEARERQTFFGLNGDFLDNIRSKITVIIDDGVATGATATVAAKIVREKKPDKLILAIPIISLKRMEELQKFFDKIIALKTPEDFTAVGQFYRNFTPVPDEQIKRLLRDES